MSQEKSEIRDAYDRAADAYAESFLDELLSKPRDNELLQAFASKLGKGQRVLDIGCGPGHTTKHLASLGLVPVGLDLSPKMISKATSLFPEVDFRVGDMFQLAQQDKTVAGILAFYCIVHLQANQLVPAFREMFRVLESNGVLLLSFHVGTEMVVQDNFLDTGAKLEFFPFLVEDVRESLLIAGFTNIEIHERPPYETEYPSNRCYVFADKPNAE